MIELFHTSRSIYQTWFSRCDCENIDTMIWLEAMLLPVLEDKLRNIATWCVSVSKSW